MITIHDLRIICKRSAIKNHTYRLLLMAASLFDKTELAQLFYKCGYSLSKFLMIVKGSQVNEEEERLIINTVKEYETPNDLHLLLSLCKSSVRLKDDLIKDGLNIKSLEEELILRTPVVNKLFQKNEFIDSSLTKLSNFTMN